MKIRTIVPALVAALLLPQAVPAGAHSWGDWYIRWTDRNVNCPGVNCLDTDRDVHWGFVTPSGTNGFPTGDSRRSRIRDAAARWNAVGTGMTFHSDLPDWSALGYPAPCPQSSSDLPDEYQRNKVGWGSFGDSTYIPGLEPAGEVRSCWWDFLDGKGPMMILFRMKINKDVNWYIGTGTPPIGTTDLWGLAAHEFGHASGRTRGGDGAGHFKDSYSVCPGDPEDGQSPSGRHTMCQTLGPGGGIGARSLEEHDRDTFVNAYS